MVAIVSRAVAALGFNQAIYPGFTRGFYQVVTGFVRVIIGKYVYTYIYIYINHFRDK